MPINDKKFSKLGIDKNIPQFNKVFIKVLQKSYN